MAPSDDPVAPAPLVFQTPLSLGVLSDTHVNDRGSRRLPREVTTLFRRLGVGLILHAGDLNSLSVLEELQLVAPTLAVRGNSDLAETRRMLPPRIDLAIGPFRIALLHGDAGRTANRTAEDAIREREAEVARVRAEEAAFQARVKAAQDAQAARAAQAQAAKAP